MDLKKKALENLIDELNKENEAERTQSLYESYRNSKQWGEFQTANEDRKEELQKTVKALRDAAIKAYEDLYDEKE